MRMNKAASLSLFAAVLAAAAPPPAVPKGALNQQAIHIAYNEGDFDKVMKEIEAFAAVNKTYSRNDSIFIAKHLAVVYTANPGTREKGKYYMYRLLEMLPSAELVDMFVSDEIDRIFEKVRKEYVARQSGFGVDTSKISLPEKPGREPLAAQPAPAQPSQAAQGPSPEFREASGKEPLWKNKVLWVAGGTGVALAGALFTFLHLSGEEEASGKTYTIPGSTQP